MGDSFLQELAQARPDPGGGAAAAYGATLGLALLEKVVRLEARRAAGDQPRQGGWEEALARLQELSQALADLRKEDVQAYFNLVRTRKAGTTAEWLAALKEAVLCPLRIVQGAREGLVLLTWAGSQCRRHLVSDLLVAAEFLNAALMGAYHIACANLPLVKEPQESAALARELVRVCQPACELFQRVKMDLVARSHEGAHCG
jgi:formiminotetrahydrofolate cyclodeaminase